VSERPPFWREFFLVFDSATLCLSTAASLDTMAANFWHSTHAADWLFDGASIARSNRGDLESASSSESEGGRGGLGWSRADVWLLRRYLADVLHELGVRLLLRQRVIATAQLLFQRFYLRASFTNFDPRLVAPTALFVAAKIEECPINGKTVIRLLNKLDSHVPTPPGAVPQAAQRAGAQLPLAMLINASAPVTGQAASAAAAAAAASYAAAASSAGAAAQPAAASSSPSGSAVAPKLVLPAYPYTLAQMLEMEFALLSGCHYDLVLWHPYRPLEQFLTELGHMELLQPCTEIVNDCYRLDLCLSHPPFLLAIASIYIACSFHGKEYRGWMSTLNVEKERIVSIVRDLLRLWDESAEYARPSTSARILMLLRQLNNVHADALSTAAKQMNAPGPTSTTAATQSRANSLTVPSSSAAAATGPALPRPSPAAMVRAPAAAPNNAQGNNAAQYANTAALPDAEARERDAKRARIA
jgi:hypothetical protein